MTLDNFTVRRLTWVIKSDMPDSSPLPIFAAGGHVLAFFGR